MHWIFLQILYNFVFYVKKFSEILEAGKNITIFSILLVYGKIGANQYNRKY